MFNRSDVYFAYSQSSRRYSPNPRRFRIARLEIKAYDEWQVSFGHCATVGTEASVQYVGEHVQRRIPRGRNLLIETAIGTVDYPVPYLPPAIIVGR